LAADADDWIYLLKTKGATSSDLARLSLAPAGHYQVTLADCRAGRADVYTKLLAAVAGSPHAAAEVRFRARQNLYLEYKSGKTGRFKPLSIAMTSYVETEPGEFSFTIRRRAARRGPVLGNLRKKIDLTPGHRHLIEIDVAGPEMLLSVEDEGLIKK